MNATDFFLDNGAPASQMFLLKQSEQCSYERLKSCVSAFSHYLEGGHPPGEKIILMVPNSLFFVVTYLSIMQTGRVVVPLNPAIDEATFNEICSQTAARTIVASRTVKARLGLTGFNVIDEEIFETICNSHHSVFLSSRVTSPNDLAQIIFTSGSTSKPKGVMISHLNLVANTKSIIEYLHLTSEDIMEVVLPFYYCYGLSLLHTHLKVGGALVLNNNFILVGGVIADLNKYKCTGFAGVPSHFQILLKKNQLFKSTQFPHLKYVTQAGGKLHDVFIKDFRSSFPNITFYVMYGQTEATARLSYLDPLFVDSKTKSIGKGIPGVELKVISESGAIAKPGEPGEIIARGDNLMLGYWQDDDATRQTIRDGWLFTGDLGYYDEDGFIFLTSRRKEIVKVGGNRVSPKEIEEVIVAMPGVVDCTIEPFAHDVLGEALRAIIVVGDGDDTPDEKTIMEHCASKLVSYKVPQEIVIKRNMTVAATGKKVKN
jgi:acyl-CoA synthetase (AMP-forming)/AMP-acid ligase II